MNEDWIECVRWCHAGEDQETVDALIESLADICQRSIYSAPILTKQRYDLGIRLSGYVVLYSGALASIGNLRSESSVDELDRDLLVGLAIDLFQESFAAGAEMVQAISPLIPSTISIDPITVFVSPNSKRDVVLQAAGMVAVAKLVQMECTNISTIPRLSIPASSLECGEIAFTPHHQVSPNRWSQLVESTYAETLDVPELNGLRNIDNTLNGYASTITGVPESWWIIQSRGIDIGCLLLTPTEDRYCELTYLGLVPTWRGKGISRIIMNFVRDWAMKCGIEGVTLAVDLRNTPAIRLYQACGFMTQQFVQAWICFPQSLKSFNPEP